MQISFWKNRPASLSHHLETLQCLFRQPGVSPASQENAFLPSLISVWEEASSYRGACATGGPGSVTVAFQAGSGGPSSPLSSQCVAMSPVLREQRRTKFFRFHGKKAVISVTWSSGVACPPFHIVRKVWQEGQYFVLLPVHPKTRMLQAGKWLGHAPAWRIPHLSIGVYMIVFTDKNYPPSGFLLNLTLGLFWARRGSTS